MELPVKGILGRRVILWLAFLSGCWGWSVTYATVIHVPAEYTTIQAAVDGSASGDTIYVSAGVYPEAVVITGKYVYLNGAASDSVTIDAFGLDAPCLTIDGPGGGQTVVRHFTLYRADGQNGALFITNAASALVESTCVAYNRATGNDRGAVSIASGAVVEIRRTRVEGNVGKTCGGVAAVGATLLLSGNLIFANRAITVGAIFVNNCITELRHNAILQNVGISPGSPPYCAVLTYGGISVAMLDNVVNLNSGYGVVLHDPITYQIEYNDVFDNSSEDYHTESWSADPGASITNISVDPELLAPEFLPQPGSPVEAAASDGGHIGLDSATAPRSPDAAPPVCGNGTLEIGEQCDDGNAQSGDGCSGSCYFECIIVLAGDVNVSGKITSADIIGLLGYIFKGGVQPLPCPAAGDVNCDGSITTADIIALIVFVFKGGAPPCNACSSPLAGQC